MVISKSTIHKFSSIQGAYLTKKSCDVFLNHLQTIIDNKVTNADHMINKFSKNEDLKELYDK